MRDRPNRRPRYAAHELERRLSPSAIVEYAGDMDVIRGVGRSIDPAAPWGPDAPDAPTTPGTPCYQPPGGPPGGTAPAPPDGDGDPPIEDPDIPIGPALPV